MTGHFEVRETPMRGLTVVTRSIFTDHRGSFERLFSDDALRGLIGDRPIRQINRSRTAKRGTVRGLHYQVPPHAEVKVVTCLRGAVLDVAVDVRAGSPTFLRWHAEPLSADLATSFVIPAGFAHGFQALTDGAEVLYLHTAAHEPVAERGLNPTDPRIDISSPEALTELSDRDRAFPLLSDAFAGVQL